MLAEELDTLEELLCQTSDRNLWKNSKILHSFESCLLSLKKIYLMVIFFEIVVFLSNQ